ncbi:MAG TPA: hypothetical protein GX696_05550, partial [Pseudomonadaceae bacterium]|nr:hypothetical protein [Pseudomonadaceae bacterium]
MATGLALSLDASAQRVPFRDPPPLRGTNVIDIDGGEFRFARLMYTENQYGRGFRGRG